MIQNRIVIVSGLILLTIIFIGWSTYESQKFVPPLSFEVVSSPVENELRTRRHSRNSSIMIAVIVEQARGVVEFTSSVLRRYHDIPSQDIYVSAPSAFDEKTLQKWYGYDITVFNSGLISAQLWKLIESFWKSQYKAIFIINGETIFSKDWKSFILRNIHKTDGFLSLYHSSNMHNYTHDCEHLDGTLCIGESTAKFGVVLERKIISDLMKSVELAEMNWTKLFGNRNVRIRYPQKSFTMQIGQRNQNVENYCGENEVAYRFSRCEFPDWIQDGIEFYFDRCTNPEESYITDYSIEKINEEKRFWVRPVISYSFYGDNWRYTKTAQENVARVFSIYPGWKIWIYTDYSVPDEIMAKMCEFDVRFIDMTGTNIINKMSWRFLVASEPVKMFAVRDIDSWLLMRGKAAVDEWIASGRMFHTMRDHENHARQPMNGGMWGGRYNAVPNMKELLDARYLTGAYMQDMDFLNEIIWKIANESVWSHDSHSLHKFGEDHPFPTELKNPRDFVGRVAIY